ncbi:MAG: GNAT family N-acetyltransferase [Bryobacterales bacterium]|nr:GNAT family N-acetyltransferase [Bryobacteraceae bacterium]MDW8354520.1 GNAT family N-acetyltransferase [Bryobacterales bacterium]
MNETILRLEPAHIPAAMRLNLLAGWNQTQADWQRVLELEPEGCFGLFRDGLLVSTTTAVCYGRKLAWIGMVLTDPEYRNRGYARRLMEHALAFLEARGVEWIKLDATAMGRPLYRKLGFEDEAPVERWAAVAPAMSPATTGDYVADAELDLRAFGADRSALLARLARGEAAAIPGQGFAFARPGSLAAYFGPCVARSAEAARNLLQWCLGRHAGQPVFWDLLPANEAALALAREFGFERRRELVRMVRRGAAARGSFDHDDSLIYAIAGFEYG